MAAYAAVVSLMHIIDLLKNHPSPPISFDKQQLHSLTQIVTFLQEFLEAYVSPFSYSDEADPLEMRIAEAVYAAEDVIESYIVDSIHLAAPSTTHDDDVMESYTVDSTQLAAAATHHENEQFRYFNFYEDLQKDIEAMDLIKKEEMDMEMVKKARSKAEVQRNVSKSSSTESKIEMVGFEDELLLLKERLVGGDPNRQIIPIVGMGGIGKTTLARNVFGEQLIKEHFDICLWATISQDYNIEQTLSDVLSLERGNSSVSELGEILHKYLFGKRYLVVLDDMWSVEVWDKMRFFFPDCGKRSRVIVTTRISNLAAHLSSSDNSLCMSFLNEVDSWTLFSNTVFGREGSVPDLEPEFREVGEKIVGKCKGLPLSIAVIGGLLAKSERTQGFWEDIEINLSSIVNLENEEYCLRVLKLSYNHLPAYLRPCFLYMGIFDEDEEIKVSTIIDLWESEGFVKPRKKKKSLKTVAREYLQELVDRNLVLGLPVSLGISALIGRELGSVGMTKWCKMHDLVRDLSLREAKKHGLYHVYSKHPPSNNGHRRIVISDNTVDDNGPRIMLEPLPNPRSYVCHDDSVELFPDFKLLRILHKTYQAGKHQYRQADVFGLVNSRLLEISIREKRCHILSSISRLWSLHTLILHSDAELEGPVEFWNMHQLKHVEFTYGRLYLQLPPPLHNDSNIVILENLHTLVGMVDFHLNEDVVRRMPNLTIFDVSYEEKMNFEVHSISYLQCLTELESFRCSVVAKSGENLQMICFPQSVKQVILIEDLCCPQVELEDVLQKLGRLPFVEELVIQSGAFRNRSWETVEGRFPRLKTLELMWCRGLENWTVSHASHFPLLEKLILFGLDEPEEIPSEIGEIATLKSITLAHCSKSAVLSAKKIVEEQEEFYGEDQLSFRVRVVDTDKALASLATPNFEVIV